MHKSCCILIFVTLSLLSGGAEHLSDTSAKDFQVHYKINEEAFSYSRENIAESKFRTSLTIRLTNQIWDYLLAFYNIPQLSLPEAMAACSIPFPQNQEMGTAANAAQDGYARVAKAKIDMARDGLTLEEAYDRCFGGNDAEKFLLRAKEWKNAIANCSFKWAEQFIQYTPQEQLQALLYQSYLDMAQRTALIRILEQKEQLPPEEVFSKVLLPRIESLQISLPEEFASCWSSAMKNIQAIIRISEFPKEVELFSREIQKKYDKQQE